MSWSSDEREDLVVDAVDGRDGHADEDPPLARELDALVRRVTARHQCDEVGADRSGPMTSFSPYHVPSRQERRLRAGRELEQLQRRRRDRPAEREVVAHEARVEERLARRRPLALLDQVAAGEEVGGDGQHG